MGPETILLLVLLGGLTLYALLGGADFGGGVWEFNTVLLSPEEERRLIYRAIGPVWEANHVWLIFVLAGLWTGFPTAFAGLCRALWLPLLLALVGIVFRGVGFAYRSYAAGSTRQQEVWGGVFAFASTAAPFFLGACAGAIASGKLAIDPEGGYHGDPLFGWLASISIYTGFFGVGLCAYLAAVYLCREAWSEGRPELVEVWRRRALATGLWMGFLAVAGLAVVASDAPALWNGLLDRGWPLVAVSMVAGVASLGALWARRFALANLGAGTAVATVLWAWAVAQYPALIPPDVTVQSTKSPDPVLRATLGAIAAGAVLLVPSLGLLFHLFKGKRPESGGSAP